MAKNIPGPLYTEHAGASGMPMLFLHPTPHDHRSWLYQMSHFSAWYRTMAVDLAGYGRSTPPQPGVRIVDLAEACWESVDRTCGEAIIIHGNSLGAHVAMHMAVLRPAHVRALVLSGCGYLPTREPMAKTIQHYETHGLAYRERQILDHFSSTFKEQPFAQHYAKMVAELNNLGTLASIIAINQALLEVEPDDFHGKLPQRTLLLSGSADFTLSRARELQKRIPGSQFAVLEGVGHACHLEAPGEYDAAALRFLAAHGLAPHGNSES